MLESPELSEQPFSVRNVGTYEAPEDVLIFNGYLAVNGPVNISQLKSGELQNGTALTVGRGSIELSTGTDGFGQMVITGSGGIANNDYLLLKVLVMVAGAHFRQPCNIHQDRAYRPTRLLD